MKSSKLWIAGIFGLGLVMAACNGDDDDAGTAPTAEEIVGKWLLRKVESQGTFSLKFPPLIDTTENIDTVETYTGSEYYAEFKSDSTYVFNQPDFDPTGMGDMGGGEEALPKLARLPEIETGTWKLTGNTLTTISTDEDTVVQQVSLSGSNLVVTYDIDTSFVDSGITFSADMNIKASFVK